MALKKKVITIELKTSMNNNDLKNLYKKHPNDMPLIGEDVKIVIDQVQINLIRTGEK